MRHITNNCFPGWISRCARAIRPVSVDLHTGQQIMEMKQTITSDTIRAQRIGAGLQKWHLNAVVGTLPENVLLLSGYWPVVGTSIALATDEGRIALIVPEDEWDLATQSWADDVATFAPASLDKISGTVAAVRDVLNSTIKKLRIERGRIGIESGATTVPASYVGMFLYESSRDELLAHALPSATLIPAETLLAQLRSVPTPYELERIRTACQIAERAFRSGTGQLQTGLRETTAATLFRTLLEETRDSHSRIERAGGFTFCMSGVNSARAYAAYQRSRETVLQQGDLALLHCNSYADGYWTDITRTFCLGGAEERVCAMYEAVFDARRAALEAIRPGVRAAEVDRAARERIKAHGFGAQFKHATGHGVGFAAIDHQALPRLHPMSDDVLEPGMVFNVEPGIYFEDFGGMRHCDMVVVTHDGAEVLTPFQSTLAELVISEPARNPQEPACHFGAVAD